MSWCPRCGRLLSNLTTGGHGFCPQHGRVAADFHEPTLVVSDSGTLGSFLRRDHHDLIYEHEGQHMIGENYADVVRWSDLEQPW